MAIQSVTGYTPQLVAAGGAMMGSSITELAQQHGVSRDSLVELVQSRIQQSRQANGQPPLDQATLDQIIDHALEHGDSQQSAHTDEPDPEDPTPPAYTANAQLSADRPRVTGTISILA